MTEDHDTAACKSLAHPSSAPQRRPRVMHHADSNPSEIQAAALRQPSPKPGIVVAQDGVGVGQPSQLVENASVEQVTGVEDGIRPLKDLQNFWREPGRPSRDMSIGDDADSHCRPLIVSPPSSEGC